MEAIEAVVALTKERDELSEELGTYDAWFEALVGKSVTLCQASKGRTRFIDCRVTDFTSGEGWELTEEDPSKGDPSVFHVTFKDFTAGRITVNRE
jgi:hypothetical protein